MRRRRAMLTVTTSSDERRTRPPRFLIGNASRRGLPRSQDCAHLVVRGLGRRPTASTAQNGHLITSPQWEGERDESTSLSESAATRACRRPLSSARAVVRTR